MVNIGRYNTLRINRFVDFGAYLEAGDGQEILIPAKFLSPKAQVGDEINVFVYKDSHDRLIATTEKPFAQVGDFVFLQVAEVNQYGAFLDWGIEAKHLLVPFSEQRDRMHQGGVYLVYIYLDDATKRIVASSKIEKFIGNVVPHYKRGDEVTALPYQHTPIGYKCIVDNLHYGMIYANEVFHPIELEEPIKVFVKNVREDGKIDLTVSDRARARTRDLAQEIMDTLLSQGGFLPVNDKTPAEEISQRFGSSKKDFKKAIGKLYKEHKIAIEEDGISLSHGDAEQ
ncbi:MAG: S1-like domain-containing RNA-binding protein [Bacteroidales bacterium]|nr:S1-like domain-containing RNA-binding protein [Bacteroidales bacterium]